MAKDETRLGGRPVRHRLSIHRSFPLPVSVLALEVQIEDLLVKERPSFRHLVLGGMDERHQSEEDRPPREAQKVGAPAVGEMAKKTLHSLLFAALPFIPQAVPGVNELLDLRPNER